MREEKKAVGTLLSFDRYVVFTCAKREATELAPREDGVGRAHFAREYTSVSALFFSFARRDIPCCRASRTDAVDNSGTHNTFRGIVVCLATDAHPPGSPMLFLLTLLFSRCISTFAHSSPPLPLLARSRSDSYSHAFPTLAM